MAFWLFGVLAVMAALLLLAVLSRIRVRVRYSRSGWEDHLAVVVKAMYGMVKIKLEFPEIAIRGGKFVYRRKMTGRFAGRAGVRKAGWKIGNGRAGPLLRHPDFRRALKKIECTRFRIDFRIGTGEAPSTAVLSGLLWTVYGCAAALAGHWMKLKSKPCGGVQPVYRGQEFSVVWEADFRVRMSAIIRPVVRMGLWKRHFRESVRRWRRGIAGPESA